MNEALYHENEARFESYIRSGAVCGPEGLPLLVSSVSFPGTRTALVAPSATFLYLAGWIGWSARGYLLHTRGLEAPENFRREIIVDIPLALEKMLGGVVWPVALWIELAQGNLIDDPHV